MAACSTVVSVPRVTSPLIAERRLYLMTSTRRVRFKDSSFGAVAKTGLWVYNLRQNFPHDAPER
jgi:hypothetical protein